MLTFFFFLHSFGFQTLCWQFRLQTTSSSVSWHCMHWMFSWRFREKVIGIELAFPFNFSILYIQDTHSEFLTFRLQVVNNLLVERGFSRACCNTFSLYDRQGLKQSKPLSFVLTYLKTLYQIKWFSYMYNETSLVRQQHYFSINVLFCENQTQYEYLSLFRIYTNLIWLFIPEN